MEYLQSKREELNKRDKGKVDKYESWFAFGRKQGLNIYQEKTDLIIIQGMFDFSVPFFKIKRKELPMNYFFTSGFILEIEEQYTNGVLHFLNSDDFKNYIKENGKILKSKKKPYYSISITKLRQLLS